MRCPACKKNTAASARYCPACGEELARKSFALEKVKGLIHLGDYQAALKELEGMPPGANPGAQILCWWGHALYYSGQTDQAFLKYREALAKDKSCWDALYQAASIAYSQGRYREAATHFNRLLALKPDTGESPLLAAFGGVEAKMLASVRLYLGLALKETGQLGEAQKHLKEASRMDPSNPLAFGIMGDIHLSQNEFPLAVAAYRGALERVADPASQLALRNDLGVAFFRSGDFSQAAEEFKAVIRSDPKNHNAIYNLGVLYLKQGMPEGMRQDWEEFSRADDTAGILFGLTRSMVEAAKTETKVQDFPGLVGGSRGMAQVTDLIRRAAASTANVLILGENGTGKELVARAIHLSSSRRERPFVAINCSALPEGLLESELFGYEKGAFTGAYAPKPGRFELAAGGTLFLDEIGDLNPAMQVKLLRVIQERTFERLGGTKTLQADIRLIGATHRDLKRRVEEGAFREDLFYRLWVIAIQIPPLRERKEDIEPLARYFMDRYNQRNHKHFTGMHAQALELLMRHEWPGNVRELENVVERAVALYDDTKIMPTHIQFDLPKTRAASLPMPTEPAGMEAADAPAGSLAEAEKRLILEHLKKNRFKVPRAAQSLGLSRATLYRKMEKMGINAKNIHE